MPFYLHLIFYALHFHRIGLNYEPYNLPNWGGGKVSKKEEFDVEIDSGGLWVSNTPTSVSTAEYAEAREQPAQRYTLTKIMPGIEPTWKK